MSDFAGYTLADWSEHIQTRHWRSIDLTLERVAAVWENLGGRVSGLVIAVAGTNGKGSCVAMLEAVLGNAGLCVGCYTSPHLVRYNERVRVGGRAADDAALCAAFAEIEAARGGIPLTYFEFGTLCALRIFQRRRVDVSLLEVGMGGRQDAVNLVDNDVALITDIGIDHAQWLGANREAIATEKAGILKKNALAVCADPAPPSAIARIAAERHCALLQSGTDYQVERSGAGIRWHSAHPALSQWSPVTELRQPFGGARQLSNLGGVVATLALTSGRTGVSEANLRAGLEHARLPARCQVIAGAPEIVLDVAHNHDSAAHLAAFLGQRKTADHGKTCGVLGMLADKPVADILSAMHGVIDRWHLATLTGERGQSAAALKKQLVKAGSASPAACYDSPLAAYLGALAEAEDRDRVVIFGSFHTVGDIIAHFEHAGGWDADAFR